MRPLFSIVTACFNAKMDLLVTAKSLEQQCFRDYEWIVIDGGSQDGTAEQLRSLSNVENWISEPDGGIADAWNKGISLCKGKQILILNAGDTYDELMLDNFSRHVSEQKITCCHAQLGCSKDSVFRARPHLLWRGMHVPHNWCSVPMSKYKEIGPYKNLKHSMDYDWFARYYKIYGVTGFNVVDKVLGVYALGGHSDTNYAAGFRQNEQIFIENGMNPVLARILRLGYALKHYYRFRLKA